MMFLYPPMNEEDDDALIQPEKGEELVTISLLKQYAYCPRIAYFETCTPGIRPTTYKMKAGTDAHELERKRAARRTLTAYQVPEGKRQFDVRLISTKLGLSGMIDEVVITPDEAIIVDYKMTQWVGDNHQIQVGAYSLMAEEAFNLPVNRGFIYLIKLRRFESIEIDEALRNSVLQTLKFTQHIRDREYMPPAVDDVNKCKSCEFRRFCNDV